MYVQFATGRGSGSSLSSHARTRVTFRFILLVLIVLALLIPLAAVHAAGPKQAPLAPANTAVTTYKNDLSRTGHQLNETILNTSNVNMNQFGKRVEYHVDGQVYAQPLYMPNVTIGGATHNVVFVATEHDQLYAFNADATSAVAPLWHRTFVHTPIVSTVSSSSVSCNNISPEYGITGTPVIDPSTNTLFVVVNTLENSGTSNIYRLHAIDLTTGNDKSGSPKVISASVHGSGGGSVNGTITFNATLQMNRPGLLLLNGVVYIGWGSHCDNHLSTYHGWVMGYSASTYQQVVVYNTTRNGYAGAIWEGGQGLVADSNGAIYFMTGNGKFDTRVSPAVDLGDSFVKLSSQNSLKVLDYFTPFNQSCLDSGDVDLGSGGPVLIPTSPQELVGAGKQGRIYVVNKDSMGGYTADPNLNSSNCGTEGARTNVDHILQELPNKTVGGVWGSPSYWNSSAGQFVYFVGSGDHAKAFKLSNGLLPHTATSQSPESWGYPGGDVVISSNGSTPGTGIAWNIGSNGVLYAYDATNLGRELYNTSQNSSRDGLPSGSYSKYSVPTVANGEVFVGTHSTLDIFGLFKTTPPTLTLSSVSPNAGPVGTSVTLSGSAFGATQGSSTVNFGNVTANVTSWSDTSIVATVPSGLPTGPINVTVTVGGQTSNSQTFNVTTLSTPAYNNTGTSDDSNPTAASFDGHGNSYSAQALQGVGITPGSTVPFNGVTFTWPTPASGQPNNWQANGQVIPVSGGGTLAFLGASANGASTGTFTVHYSGGGTQTFNLTVSDWTLGGGTMSPSPGNQIVVTMSYRNTPTGKQTHKPYVFYIQVTLTVPSGQTIQSVQLPATESPGQIHIFAIGTK